MKLFEYTVTVAANPVRVYQFIADPRSKLVWVPAIRRVSLISKQPVAVGMRYLASSAVGPFEFIFNEQIVELVENKKIAYEGHSKWGNFRTTVNLKPHDDEGTRVYYRMDYVFPCGLIGAVFGRIVGFFIRRPMQTRSAKYLKKAIEEGLWQPEDNSFIR
ncbi:MAG: SRPBCC family protein [Actinobacteria bacterium]|nr:SRPBCC family protein [Actinomycetota bacterium]